VLGRADLDPGLVPHDLLTATLPLGTRRLPAAATAAPQAPAALTQAGPEVTLVGAPAIPTAGVAPALPNSLLVSLQLAAPSASLATTPGGARSSPVASVPAATPDREAVGPLDTSIRPAATVAVLDRVFADPDDLFQGGIQDAFDKEEPQGPTR
jgi:hypothetical protein